MPCPRIARIALLIAGLAPSATAQLAPPMVRSSKPIGAAAGDSVALEVKASDVRDGSAIRFDDPRVKVEGVELSRGDGNGPRTIKAKVTLPSEVDPGPLRFRVVGAGGVSDPGQILVGRSIPTVPEAEPNNRLNRPQVMGGPAAVEGSLANGDDVDVFGVEMKAGETLAAEVVAARAGSRLDAYLTIYAPDGRELAANDDAFGKDAAAWATVPASGRYLVAVQDAEGRHRDGGIEQKMTRPYRLEFGRIALITAAFPAGARRGEGATLRLTGANLPEGGSARFDPPADAPLGDRAFAIRGPLGGSNPLTLRVGDLAEHPGLESKGRLEAPVVVAPAAIDGVFAGVEVYRLKAEPGREGDYAISAYAARVGSPSDPVLATLDARGEPQGEDDDQLGRDSRIVRRVDSGDGLLVSVRDYYGRSGGRFTYRIEVEPVTPRVEVVAELGHRTIPRAGALVVPVAIERRGFPGPVTILAEGLPPGVSSGPLTLGEGDSKGFLAFSATPDAPIGAFSPRLAAQDRAATIRFRERGPLDEVPREGDQQKGPRETVVDAAEPALAVADRASITLAAPSGPIEVARDGRVEVTFPIDRPGDPAGAKRIKVRLVTPGKALDQFDPVAVLDLAPDARAATFALKPKSGTKAGEMTLAAHAWLEGVPEILGVDSPTVVLTIK